MLETAIVTARQAGALLRSYYERGVTTEYKGEIDLITEADRVSEELILRTLSSRFPDHGFYAEESGERSNGASHVWLIDPLDGTTNFAHGYPVFCVALALQVELQSALSVIYDPMRDELFSALRGRGAFLNGRTMHVSQTATLAQSLVATGFPYDRKTNPHNNVRQHEAFLMHSQGVIRPGSASLDLASVACGRVDGYWEFRLQAWDMAPGALLVELAGGRVSDPQGEALGSRPRNTVASNGQIHEEMLEVLREIG
ncbi:MAG: inositol monophosphatase family protein [Longimicrobiales bacterium]